MRKLAPARASHWDDFLISYRVYMMTGSFHILLFNVTFHVDKIHVWFKIANITHALPVPVYRQTDFTPKWVVVSRLHDTVARFRSGVNSHRSDSRRHNILWWYHVNKYRAMRGNRSELTPGRKSPRCHVKTPPKLWEETATARTIGIPNNEGKRLQPPPGKVGRAKPLSHIQ